METAVPYKYVFKITKQCVKQPNWEIIKKLNLLCEASIDLPTLDEKKKYNILTCQSIFPQITILYQLLMMVNIIDLKQSFSSLCKHKL